MNQATIYRIYQGFAWIIFAGFLLQFFLAGLGVFRAATFGPHRTLGDLLMVASVLLLILAVASFVISNLVDRWKVGLAALLVILMLLQYLLASDFLQEGAPVISALHPVNGLLLVFTSYALAYRRGLPPWATGSTTAGGGAARGSSSRVR